MNLLQQQKIFPFHIAPLLWHCIPLLQKQLFHFSMFSTKSQTWNTTFKHPSELLQFCLQVSGSGWSLEPSVYYRIAILYHSNQSGEKKINIVILFFFPALWILPLCLNYPLFCILLLLILLLANFSSYCWFLSQSIISTFVPLSPESLFGI